LRGTQEIPQHNRLCNVIDLVTAHPFSPNILENDKTGIIDVIESLKYSIVINRVLFDRGLEFSTASAPGVEVRSEGYEWFDFVVNNSLAREMFLLQGKS
jgi:hypothetical protein